MVDILSLVYGVATAIAILIVMRIVDLILEHFLDKTVFNRIWTMFTIAVKKFQTRFNPIIMCFKFRVKFEPCEPTRVKYDLTTLIQSLSEEHKGQIAFSPLTWTDDDKVGSVNVTYNERSTELTCILALNSRNTNQKRRYLRILARAKKSQTA